MEPFSKTLSTSPHRYWAIALPLLTLAILVFFALPTQLKRIDSTPVHSTFTPPPNLAVSNKNSTAIPSLPVAWIKELALMGKPAAPTTPVIEETPESTRHLALKGLFANSNAEQGAALISINNADAQYFYVGEEVLPDLALSSISAEGVILKSSTGFEKLVFQKPSIWTPLIARNEDSAQSIENNALPLELFPLPGKARANTTIALQNAFSGHDSTTAEDQNPLQLLSTQYSNLTAVRNRLKGKQ